MVILIRVQEVLWNTVQGDRGCSYRVGYKNKWDLWSDLLFSIGHRTSICISYINAIICDGVKVLDDLGVNICTMGGNSLHIILYIYNTHSYTALVTLPLWKMEGNKHF